MGIACVHKMHQLRHVTLTHLARPLSCVCTLSRARLVVAGEYMVEPSCQRASSERDGSRLRWLWLLCGLVDPCLLGIEISMAAAQTRTQMPSRPNLLATPWVNHRGVGAQVRRFTRADRINKLCDPSHRRRAHLTTASPASHRLQISQVNSGQSTPKSSKVKSTPAHSAGSRF